LGERERGDRGSKRETSILDIGFIFPFKRTHF
jgi:hypothetical protein